MPTETIKLGFIMVFPHPEGGYRESTGDPARAILGPEAGPVKQGHELAFAVNRSEAFKL
jgi:hypothetical protein